LATQDNHDFAAPSIEEQPFHCCAEWHLAKTRKLHSVMVYTFALRISHGSKTKPKGHFYCSAPSLSRFFGYSEQHIRDAFKALEQTGFFKRLQQGFFGPSTYRVLTHKEWIEEHPGQCTTKIEYGDDDTLAQRLYGCTGGKVKFTKSHMKDLRKYGRDVRSGVD
jgi:hypothetical protein